MNFMKFEKVLAERKDKVIYKDGDKCIKVFDESYKKSDILLQENGLLSVSAALFPQSDNIFLLFS